MNPDKRLETTIVLKDLFSWMKDEGLVFTKESELKTDKLRERFLNKKNLTYKQISDSEIWGNIGKKAVEAIAKKELQEHEIFKRGNSFRIHISAVKRVAENRGTL